MTQSEVAVAITFLVPSEDADGTFQEVPEAEAVVFFAANPGRLQPSGEQEGGIAISGAGAEAGFADTLLWLGPALCLKAVAELADTGRSSFTLFGIDTEVTLERDGDAVRITADIMAPATFPAGPLTAALAQAGERLVELTAQLWPDYRGLPKLRERAADALATAGAPGVRLG